jgi:hypothetical protein
MTVGRTEADCDLIRGGFIDSFVNAYNLWLAELDRLKSSEVNTGWIYDSAVVCAAHSAWCVACAADDSS